MSNATTVSFENPAGELIVWRLLRSLRRKPKVTGAEATHEAEQPKPSRHDNHLARIREEVMLQNMFMRVNL